MLDRRRFIHSASAFLSIGSTAILGGCSSRTPSKIHDVIVVGAGLAGLNAALSLADMGYSPLVLEGSKRVGGRVFTYRGNGWGVEVGGQEVGGMYSHTLSAIDRFSLKKETVDLGLNGYTYLVDGKIYSKSSFDAAFKDLLIPSELKLAPLRLKSLYHPVEIDRNIENWGSPELKKYDLSIKAYMEEVGASKEAIRLLEASNTSPIDDTSILWEGRRKEFSRVNAMQRFYHLSDGMDSLPKAMASALPQPVHFSKKIAAIVDKGDHSEVYCEDGSSYKARGVILTVPLPIIKTIDIKTLSSFRREAVKEMNFGHGLCVYFKIKENYWEKDNLPASLWTDGQFGRMFKWRNSFGEYIWNYITGPEAEKFRGKSDKEVFSSILTSLAAVRPAMAEALEPLFRFSWTENPFSNGTFHYWGPGDAKFANAFRGLEGNLAFAGEHTMSVEMGMEAAMSSGLQAAIEISDIL